MRRAKPKMIRPSVEQLEVRENPAAVDVVLSEGFDTVNAPTLPAAWSNWSSDGQQQFLTSKLAASTGPNSLASVGGSAIQSRFWYKTAFDADYGASVSLRIDTPTPVELITRGQALDSSKPSYISATIRNGGMIELVEVRNGVRSVIGSVRPTAAINSGWVRITVRPINNSAIVQLQRLDTGSYLNSTGAWQSAPADALRLKLTTNSGPGMLGVGRIPGNGGYVFFDDFAIHAPPGLKETFDTTATGSMPAGWQTWSSDATGIVNVQLTKSAPISPALSADGNSLNASRAWSSQEMPANVQATVSVFADSLIPAGIIIDGRALDTTRPTYYSLTATRGVNIQIKRVVDGTETVLGSLRSSVYTSQIWLQLTLVAQGDMFKAIVYRADTKQWLGGDGAWKSDAESALFVQDSTILNGGLVGVERSRSAAGKVWFDNLDVRIAGAVVPPTVTVSASQTGAVSNAVTFTAAATASSTLAKVEYILDGTVRFTQNTASSRWEFDSTTVSNGAHQLVVRAVDSEGNVGAATLAFDVQNVVVAAPVRPDSVHKYSHIRIAQLAYSGNPMGAFEQDLAANSLDLIVANPQYLSTLEAAAPTTPTIIYTNLSNLYDGLLSNWLEYADRNGIARELAFYHVTQATAFSGGSPSARPVNWLWNVSLASATGGTATDLTANARGGRLTGVAFGATGQAISMGYTDRFRELNFALNRAAASGWQGIFEYVSRVDAGGNPIEWKTLTLLADGTNGFRNDGRVVFDPPADWVAAKNPNGSDRLFQIRFRTTAGTAALAPEAKTIFGRDYVNANGAQAGTIPAFDSTADVDGNGYLSDAEYANRRSGYDARFDYESRLFYPYYGQMRFVTNPSSSAVRTWAAEYHAALILNYPLADGFYIDNANGRLPFAGTPVRESVTTFTNDSALMVNAVWRSLSPKWVITNTSGSRSEGNPMAASSTGAFEEFLLRPNDVTWSGVLDVASLVSARLAASNPSPYLILDSHPGSQPTTDARTRMSTLAYYYLLGDPDRTFLMFFGGNKPAANWSSIWVPAAAVDVGQPAGAMTVFKTGQDPANPDLKYQIYRRDYGNAMVLFKPLSYTLGKGTGTNSDASATPVELGGSYRVLNADGTLGPVIMSIDLRNAEGVVLIKAT